MIDNLDKRDNIKINLTKFNEIRSMNFQKNKRYEIINYSRQSILSNNKVAIESNQNVQDIFDTVPLIN
jgi:hypothetical protein